MNKAKNSYTLAQSFIAVFILFASLFMMSCEFWQVPVRDYLEKWTSQVSIEKYELYGIETYTDKDGNLCIPSGQDVPVSLFMINPYHYDFRDFPGKITSVENESIGGNAFPTITPDNEDTTVLHFTYGSNYLTAYECGHDIGAIITVEHPYNSSERKEFPLVIKCNSKPPAINYGAVMQNNNTYFLCFNIAPSSISEIHTDIKQIVIDDGSNTRTSACHVESNGNIVLDSSDSLSKTSPGTLTAAGPRASFTPDSTNAFYFNSGISVEADREMSFTITLLDEAGLSSSTVISTASRQLEAPRAWDSVAEIELVPSTTTSVLNTLVLNSNYEGLINLSLPTQTINGDPVSGVRVKYRLIGGGGTRTEYQGDDITVSETGEHKLQVWAEKEGYVNSATVIYTIKVRPLVITFYKNDETNATATQEVSRNTDVTLNSLSQLGLERTGYTFDNWKESEDSIDVYNNTQQNVRFNRDIDLYAFWTANTYTVTLDYNYTDAPNSTTISVTYDSGYTALPSSDPTRTGYRFDGWFTSATGGTKITDQTSCTTASDHTLYAHWTARTYTVTLKYNYTNYGTYTTITVPYDAKYSDYLPSNPNRQGYSFVEWWTTPDNTGTKITAQTLCETASGHNLYAHWNPNTYTVKFHLNGGEGTTPQNATVTYAAKYNQGTNWPTTAPTKTGYTFDGWYTSANGGVKKDGEDTVWITETQDLYAHWNLNYHSVTCDSTNCSVSITSDVRQGNTYGYGSTVTVVITPTGDYGVYSITVPDGLNATDPVESGTNGKTNTITFTMPDEDVTVTRVIKQAITVNITPYNCSYTQNDETITEFVKTYTKNKKVRLWCKSMSACYDREGEYKDVTLDRNGEYHGYICYPDRASPIGVTAPSKVCVMSISTLGTSTIGCRAFGYSTTSSDNCNIDLAVILFQIWGKDSPDYTIYEKFKECGSTIYSSADWESFGFQFYWEIRDSSGNVIHTYQSNTNLWTFNTSVLVEGTNKTYGYIYAAGIKASSNNSYWPISYP